MLDHPLGGGIIPITIYGELQWHFKQIKSKISGNIVLYPPFKKTYSNTQSFHSPPYPLLSSPLVLQQLQGTSNDNILQNTARRDINPLTIIAHDNNRSLQLNTTTKDNITSNGQMIQLDNLGDSRDPLLEVRDLLVLRTELDQGCRTETGGSHDELSVVKGVEIRLDEEEVRASLDRQESATGDVDTVCALEVLNGITDGSLELDDVNVRLALLVGRDGLVVRDDLQLQLLVLDDALDGGEGEPDVVGVEVLELLDGLELLNVLGRNLSDLEKTDGALVLDNGTTLDIGLGLVSQLHDVLSARLGHVGKDVQVNNSTQVVNVGNEQDLLTLGNEGVQQARVGKGLEDVTVTGGVPLVDSGVVGAGNGEVGFAVDAGVAGLVEGEDIDVVTLVLLDDASGVVVSVERVHENERNVGIVLPVQVL
ncbi:hypothetical protein G7K_4366-t1 [Saitoella complicata NRRL Y-17804]|uniref:Uncharacterized protein n=1 Tax=Saitoella complicata (strain BCRC 22490 / CBS 7301 / JCM 7358 / NBRC 10748 / NRRL Y-17804) TaxID=698492 RepID=A0A0E9NK66_SAICN|nr:hypothetical protein G7K_4366-t1 [Saitoella complicata NRRL Y-17804]